MATEKSAKKATEYGPTKGLKVVARPDSFRRAGREFGREATVIPCKELTSDQIDALVNEPELVVVVVDLPPPADEKPE